MQLKDIRSRVLLYNKNYAKAMDEEDFLEVAIQSAHYQDMQTLKKKNMWNCAKSIILNYKDLQERKSLTV